MASSTGKPGRVYDLYVAEETARGELREILSDEPGWAEHLQVVAVDLGGEEPTVAGVEAPAGAPRRVAVTVGRDKLDAKSDPR